MKIRKIQAESKKFLKLNEDIKEFNRIFTKF